MNYDKPLSGLSEVVSLFSVQSVDHVRDHVSSQEHVID